jgi:hypothetical protein
VVVEGGRLVGGVGSAVDGRFAVGVGVVAILVGIFGDGLYAVLGHGN